MGGGPRKGWIEGEEETVGALGSGYGWIGLRKY